MRDVRRLQVRVTMVDKDATFVECVLRFCAQSEPAVLITHVVDVAELRAHGQWSRPDVVTLDPDQLDDPAAGVLASTALPSRPAVIALTTISDSAVAAELATTGALGWVGKDEPVAALIDAIRAVHEGQARYPAAHLGAVLRALADQARAAQPVRQRAGRTLTRREHEVLAQLLSGATPREIAHRLNLSENTIRAHRRRIGAKLGVHA